MALKAIKEACITLVNPINTMSLQTDISKANECIVEIFASGNAKRILELYELIGADKEYVIDAVEGLAGDDRTEFRRTLQTMKKLAKHPKQSLQQKTAENLCTQLLDHKAIGPDEYQTMKSLHPALKDPGASIIFGFIWQWGQWRTAHMPLKIEELQAIVEVLREIK